MLNTFKKTFVIMFFFSLFLASPLFVSAGTDYTTLAPITGYVGVNDGIEKIDEKSFSTYLNNMFKLGIALCTGLAVLMLIIGGIQYVSSDAWSKKTDGRERMFAALFGLLIALGSYALLQTLSPDLLSTELTMKPVKLTDPIKPTQQNQNPNSSTNTNTNTNTTQPPTNPSSTTTPPTINVTSNQGFEEKLAKTGSDLKNKGINTSMTVTGNYAQINSNVFTVDTVNEIIAAGNTNGLDVKYQLNAENPRIQQLRDLGFPEQNLKVINGGESGQEGLFLYNK